MSIAPVKPPTTQEARLIIDPEHEKAEILLNLPLEMLAQGAVVCEMIDGELAEKIGDMEEMLEEDE